MHNYNVYNQQSSKKQMLTFLWECVFKMCIQPTYDQMAIILDLKNLRLFVTLELKYNS